MRTCVREDGGTSARQGAAPMTTGCSIKEIAGQLGVSVSSVSLWVRDIALTPEQQRSARASQSDPQRSAPGQREQHRTLPRGPARGAGPRPRARARRRTRCTPRDACSIGPRGRRRATRSCWPTPTPTSRSSSSGSFAAATASWTTRIALSVNCFVDNGLTVREIEQWWLARLALPVTCLRTAAVNRPSSASRRLEGQRPSVWHRRAYASNSTFVVQSIYGAIQEYAGIDRPEWLDL